MARLHASNRSNQERPNDEEVNQYLHEATDGWYEDPAFFGAMAHQPGGSGFAY